MQQTNQITVKQGKSFSASIKVRSADGSLVDLTGRTFTGRAKYNYSSELLFSFVVEIKNQTTNRGEINWTLPYDALDGLVLKEVTKAIYDIVMIMPNGVPVDFIGGLVTIIPEV